MSDIVIKAEGLGKKYLIGHQSERERYTALRDVIGRGVKGLLNKTRQVLSGQQLLAGDEIEEFWALKNIDFEIKRGDRVGIIGRNGAGKSTLLKVLSRITEPSTGRIEIRGRVASLLEVGTGFHPELSGRENIFLNGAILGMSRVEIKRKFDEIVDFAGVEKFLDTPVKRYSSGMYVRLAFAVAAHLEPEILIVDEVLAVGDAEFQKKCLGKMEDVSKNEGRTVLFVSHNMGVMAQLCNQAILLNAGKLILKGNTNSVIEDYIASSNEEKKGFFLNENETNSNKKHNYFVSIFTTNKKNEHTNDYSFTESIILSFSFKINQYATNLQIGISLQDKHKNAVTTIVESIDKFKTNTLGYYKGKVEFPSSIIAPNSYTFLCVLSTKELEIHDYIDNACSVKIHDNGTELSLYEGLDYGNVILKTLWTNG